jgi:hypothetical protein
MERRAGAERLKRRTLLQGIKRPSGTEQSLSGWGQNGPTPRGAGRAPSRTEPLFISGSHPGHHSRSMSSTGTWPARGTVAATGRSRCSARSQSRPRLSRQCHRSSKSACLRRPHGCARARMCEACAGAYPPNIICTSGRPSRSRPPHPNHGQGGGAVNEQSAGRQGLVVAVLAIGALPGYLATWLAPAAALQN